MNDLVQNEPRRTLPEGEALAGVIRWLSIHDDLLRGLTHTLSNRVGTIAAAAYMVEVQPASMAASAATLRAESEKLESLLRLLRLLPRRVVGAGEPVIPTDAASVAIELYGHHPKQTSAPITMVVEGDLQPAFVEPAALTMAVVVGLDAAHRGIATAAAQLSVTITCSTDWVTLHMHARDETVSTDVADNLAAITWLLLPFGGHSAPHALGASLMIPTLQATRRALRDSSQPR